MNNCEECDGSSECQECMGEEEVRCACEVGSSYCLDCNGYGFVVCENCDGSGCCPECEDEEKFKGLSVVVNLVHLCDGLYHYYRRRER